MDRWIRNNNSGKGKWISGNWEKTTGKPFKTCFGSSRTKFPSDEEEFETIKLMQKTITENMKAISTRIVSSDDVAVIDEERKRKVKTAVYQLPVFEKPREKETDLQYQTDPDELAVEERTRKRRWRKKERKKW